MLAGWPRRNAFCGCDVCGPRTLPVITLGIAGHVDHGKTSLVRALTGMETDRLPEEQRRGISIELGFAWLDVALADGHTERVALVDMPGHERFVRRMIAGAAGIDAVLLVVAADEGAMPQGREHLAICSLLGISRGAVVLTKSDLVDDSLIDLAREDIGQLTQGTFLADAPVWPVSVRRAETMVQFKAALTAWVQDLVDARHRGGGQEGRPLLLSVDRAFVLAGRGTVVTGTAVQGEVNLEQGLAALPGREVFRVRSLEQHGQACKQVRAPGRVAINLAAATLEQVPVGTLLAPPGTVIVGSRFDATLTTLPHAPQLATRQRVTVHLGTAQSEARVVQLSGEGQAAGSRALVQVQLDRPLALPPGAPFVIRSSRVDPRHGQTLGGGRVLFPEPQRHRLGDETTLAALQRLSEPQLEGQVLAALGLAGIRGLDELGLSQTVPASGSAIAKTVKQLLGQGAVRRLGTQVLTVAAASQLEATVLRAIAAFHRQHPTRGGMETEALERSVADWIAAGVVQQTAVGLGKRGQLVQREAAGGRGLQWALPGFQPKATVDTAVVDAVVAALAPHGLAPPLLASLAADLGVDAKTLQLALQRACADGRLARVADDYYVTTAATRSAIDAVMRALAAQDSFSTGELKELLGLTRKHLIPFAEYLDAERWTVRDPAGNRRIRERAREAWRASQNGTATD